MGVAADSSRPAGTAHDALGKRVAVLDTGYDSYAAEREALRQADAFLELFEGGRHDRAGKLAFGRGAAGIFVRWTLVDEAFLEGLPGLEAVVRYGVGYDNVDLAAASARGVKVCNVQGYANHSVSDHALALIMASVRGLRQGMQQLRTDYGAPPWESLGELKDMTLGIVGLGRIGGTLCAKARALFGRVLACDPYIPEERFSALGASRCDLDVLLGASEVVSVHCTLTPETQGIFDATAFAKMRPSSVFVNTARGPIADEEALLAALDRGHLVAAGLDVFCDEPPLSNRDALIAHPRVTATGHYGWYTTAASEELQRRAGANMAAMLCGTLPEDCLNAAAFR